MCTTRFCSSRGRGRLSGVILYPLDTQPLDTFPPGYPTPLDILPHQIPYTPPDTLSPQIPYPVPFWKGHGTRNIPLLLPGRDMGLEILYYPLHEQTDACENITFPQLLFRVVKIVFHGKKTHFMCTHMKSLFLSVRNLIAQYII